MVISRNVRRASPLFPRGRGLVGLGHTMLCTGEQARSEEGEEEGGGGRPVAASGGGVPADGGAIFVECVSLSIHFYP